MFHVLFNGNLIVGVTTESPFTGTPKLKDLFDPKTGAKIVYDRVEDRWDWKTMDRVRELAAKLTAITGKTYLPADAGSAVSPRYDVFQPPAIGDDVSYGFNGDYYPCGKIVRITKGWRITTSEGKVFNRRKESAGWRMVGGTWSLVQGTHYEQNPSF
jgi:hypothetical protein